MSVKGKLEVLNANIVNVLQSCLSELCPACERAIGGELEFVATSVLIALRASCSVSHMKRQAYSQHDYG